ncbi:MAG TPA: hypothetical protein VFE13_13255, partial [Caulobacteraceae bacterium]|nr:hypothetical protein [Caulobacteraceae bacterium]
GLLLLVFGGTAFLAAGLCWLVVGLMIRAHARRIEARAAAMTLAPGVIVRVDPTGVSVDGRAWAWCSLRIDELGVRERQGNDTRITYVERLALSNGQRRLNLDALFLTNGRALLQQIWRRSRGTPA